MDDNQETIVKKVEEFFFSSGLDKAIGRNIEEFPEMVLERGAWEVKILCLNCKNAFPDSFLGRIPKSGVIFWSPKSYWGRLGSHISRYSCPKCSNYSLKKLEGVSGSAMGQITLPNFLKVRRRFLTLSKKATGNWWKGKKVEISGVWEIQVLSIFYDMKYYEVNSVKSFFI